MVDVTEVRDGMVAAFRTERLVGRMMAECDADYLTDLHSDKTVMATIGGVRDNLQCAVWLDANLRHWTEHGFGQWMLDNDDACIGRGGLRKIDESVGEDLVEIGYVIGRSHWGNGYATEATATFIEIAFDYYGLDQLGAITVEGNDASTRVLEKCGFVFERWVDHHVGRHRFLRLVAT